MNTEKIMKAQFLLPIILAVVFVATAMVMLPPLVANADSQDGFNYTIKAAGEGASGEGAYITSYDTRKGTSVKIPEKLGAKPVVSAELINLKLTSLDVNEAKHLISLTVNGNRLSALNLGNNVKLASLYCDDNLLLSLDVKKNTALFNLSFTNNQLTYIDLRNNTDLAFLKCADNMMTVLDVSSNTSLRSLNCQNNKLTKLTMDNNPVLTYVYCENNLLDKIDVSKVPALSQLSCNDNKLTSLDLSNNLSLKHLYCFNNNLKKLDLSKHELTNLNCIRNDIMDIKLLKTLAAKYGKGNVVPQTNPLKISEAKASNCRLLNCTTLERLRKS